MILTLITADTRVYNGPTASFYGLSDSGFELPLLQGIFYSRYPSRETLGPQAALCTVGVRALSPGGNHTPPSAVEVKNEWSDIFTPSL